MPISWEQLIRLSDAELSKIDIVSVNLACALGLPRVHNCDVVQLAKTLDTWAEQVQKETKRLNRLFRSKPRKFNNSQAQFCIEVMLTVLQRDIGIRYDPALVDRDDFFRDPRNLFVPGVVATKRGTCTSLPPFYVAVGRRLGYPLYLVSSKSHLFARWHDRSERFNIECTSRGFVSHPDEHYLQWPTPTPYYQARLFAFLESKTPRAELANFIVARGHCFLDNRLHKQAAEAYGWATDLQPNCRLHPSSMAVAVKRWRQKLKDDNPGVTPPGATVHFERRWRSVPADLENQFVALEHVEGWLGSRPGSGTTKSNEVKDSPCSYLAPPAPSSTIHTELDHINLGEPNAPKEDFCDAPLALDQ